MIVYWAYLDTGYWLLATGCLELDAAECRVPAAYCPGACPELVEGPTGERSKAELGEANRYILLSFVLCDIFNFLVLIYMNLQKIRSKIFEIRGQKVILDFDLAILYEVETKALNQAVKRNNQRFPHE